MNEYKTVKIRNVVILGSRACGKTTLTEAMAFTSSLTNKLGRVQDGDTISDFDRLEMKEGSSLQMSVIPIEWDGHKINLLDTPGESELIGEREQAVQAADAAVIVINGKRGVEAGTLQAWKLCDKYELPRVVYVTAMDDDSASYKNVIESLTALYGKRIAPFHQPLRENGKFIGYVNIAKLTARKFTGLLRYEVSDIPNYSYENLWHFREILIEAVASTSDTLLEKYFEKHEFTQEEIDLALRVNCCRGTIVPVTMGTGLDVYGVFLVLNDIVRYMPSPTITQIGHCADSKDSFIGNYNVESDFTAQVIKIVNSPVIGKYCIFKVLSGRIKKGMDVYNPKNRTHHTISKLYRISGKEIIEVESIYAGDIGVISKLDFSTGDTISTVKRPVLYEPPTYSKPYTCMRYEMIDDSDYKKALTAIGELMEEDVTLNCGYDAENVQNLLYGIGEKHLSTVVKKLSDRYNVQMSLNQMYIAYRETITKKVTVIENCGQLDGSEEEGKNRQEMRVSLTLEPARDEIKVNTMIQNMNCSQMSHQIYMQTEKIMGEFSKKGLLGHFPVRGIVGTITVLGEEAKIEMDNISEVIENALKKAYLLSEPVLIEPIVTLVVSFAEPYFHNVMQDLKRRRAIVLGMTDGDNNNKVVAADVPLAQMGEYAAVLSSISEETGDFSYEFSRYEKLPQDNWENIAKIRINQ